MIEIDIILGSKYESSWREEMICMSGALVLIAEVWNIDGQLQLDDGGENT
jgi:hypothetical protein